MTKSNPISPPARKASKDAIAVSTCMRISVFVFMVMLALYTSVITCSASACPGLMVPDNADRISWEGELWTAATLIPTFLREGLLPVELSERRPS